MYLGFQSFKNLREFGRTTAQIRKDQYQQRYKNTSVEAMLANIRFISKNEFDQNQFLEQVNVAADMIHQAKRLVFIGALFPLSLSLDMAEDLLNTGKAVIYNQLFTDFGIRRFEKGALIIIPTLTGNFIPANVPGFLDQVKSFPLLFLSKREIRKIPFQQFNLIQLPNLNQSNQSNLILLETYNLIKYMYFNKYIY